MRLTCLAVVFAQAPTILAFVSPSTKTSFLVRINKNCRPSADNGLKSAVEATTIVQELQDLDDFDPTIHGDDEKGTKTKELLEASIRVLEKVVDSEEEDLMNEILDDDDTEDSVTTRSSITRSIPAPKKKNGKSLVRLLFRRKKKNGATEPTSSSTEPSTNNNNGSNKSVLRGSIDLIKLLLKLGVFSEPKLKYATYPRHPEYPGIDLSKSMKMLDGVPPLEYFFSVKKTLRLVKHTTKNAVGMKLRADNVKRAKTAEERYRALFTKKRLFWFLPNPLNLVPLPEHVVNHWQDDKEVARQFLCGVNPVMICVVKNVQEQLSSPLVQQFGKTKLQKLVNDKRLFYVSYDDIAKLEEQSYKNPHLSYPPPMNKSPPPDEPERLLEDRFFHAPIALFELDEKRKELNVMGIQLERQPDAKVYTRENSTPDEWLFVKACLTNADSQMHEWVSHLGKTHLTMEPHIIAIHNTLKRKNHPLYAYLKPLCKDTLLLNWAARRTLADFGENSFGDYMTSVGTGQFMQLIGFYWSTYDFFNSSGLPSELKSRGFDESFDMPCYLYRQDGLELWNAYGQFASDFVNELYPTDVQVKQDEVLQQWAEETVAADRGNVPGFPATFQDKETLAKVLQTLNWITGGLHAAVNFPQYEFFSYSPNKPLHKKGTTPTKDEIRNIQRTRIFNSTMPSMPFAEQALSTVHALTFQTGHCIDNLSTEFPKDRVGYNSYQKLLGTLRKVGNKIERRNKWNKMKRGPVYSYLHPSEVPASIDI